MPASRSTRFAVLTAATLCFARIPTDLAAQGKPAVAVIGTGTFADAFGPALGRSGYRVVYGSRNPDRDVVRTLVSRSGPAASAASQREAAARADVVMLAVPEAVLFEVTRSLGDLSGKVVITVAGGEGRVADDGYLELVQDSTYGERLQARHARAHIVRMNSPNIAYFVDPNLVPTPPTVLIAGNDPAARAVVARIVFDLGLNPWDAGPIRFARVFNALNWMLSIPAQQRRVEQYELNLMPGVPFACFFDVVKEFGYGRPNELDSLVAFPRRKPVVPCDEWRRRLGMPDG